MTRNMKSCSVLWHPGCFLYGPGVAEIEDQPIPTLSDPYDVIARIEYVRACGSDVSDSNPQFLFPLVL